MRRTGMSALLGLTLLGVAGSARAALDLRVQVQQRGDFVIIGNTLGHDCAPQVPAPIVGVVGDCGADVNDTSLDVFWRADSPVAGNAEANTSILAKEARTTAVLALPPGATVTHARLYWTATPAGPSPDTNVTVRLPDLTSFVVTAQDAYMLGNQFYQSVADVTALVQAAGQGFYQISGVAMPNPVDVNDSSLTGAWWLVVFYQQDSAPPRKLLLFDAFDVVSDGNPSCTALSGFLVPAGAVQAKLAVVAFEGDFVITGDQVFFNGGQPLSNATNPANDFFNSTRSYLGAPVSNPGDLPRLSGQPGSMQGLDIDVVDVTASVNPGDASALACFTSTGDIYTVSGFVASISSTAPELVHAEMVAIDLNGGLVLPGDTLEFVAVVPNTGNDVSIGTRLTHAMPPGLTYLPGSLQITGGSNVGAMTDAPGDDQAEYDDAENTVVFRLGAGADAIQGGSLAVEASAAVAFRATVDPGVFGDIESQAKIEATGQYALPEDVATSTDGDNTAPGNQPTRVVVSQCAESAECPAALPFCFTKALPRSCVECLADADCPTAPCFEESSCEPTLHYCIAGAPKPDGSYCDDGDPACTSADRCESGVCLGSPRTCDEPAACHDQAACQPLVGCPPPVLSPDGAACDDADDCTLNDQCGAGICRGVPLSCAGYGCDPEAGACRTACATVDDCALGKVCDPDGRCVDPLPRASSLDLTTCAVGLPGGGASSPFCSCNAALSLLAMAAMAARGRRSARRPSASPPSP